LHFAVLIAGADTRVKSATHSIIVHGFRTIVNTRTTQGVPPFAGASERRQRPAEPWNGRHQKELTQCFFRSGFPLARVILTRRTRGGIGRTFSYKQFSKWILPASTGKRIPGRIPKRDSGPVYVHPLNRTTGTTQGLGNELT
jgi:hypothetical protein